MRSRPRTLYSRRSAWLFCFLTSLLALFLAVALASAFWLPHALPQQHAMIMQSDANKRDRPKMQKEQGAVKTHEMGESQKVGYEYWRNVAMKLARLPPNQILLNLEQQDPFEVRRFEERLLKLEADRTSESGTLDPEQLFELFACPQGDRRLTSPDQRNHTRSDEFKAGSGFLFFQHLRKAGGTNFCTLATKNLPKRALPPYFCMPDMHWPRTRGAGYLHQWSNADIVRLIEHYRVAGNEWDNFDPSRHFDLPAVFATSFRRPLERALSQFRFECLENRGCPIKNVTKWWERRQDLANVYTRTFADPRGLAGLLRTYRGTSAANGEKRAELLGRALDTVAKFHLVTVMEWLPYAAPLVTRVLGFENTDPLTRRVRPHIGQAPRHDGPDHNEQGARGVVEHNHEAVSDILSTLPELRAQMSQDLALDEVLTDAARRIFLEHLVCND